MDVCWGFVSYYAQFACRMDFPDSDWNVRIFLMHVLHFRYFTIALVFASLYYWAVSASAYVHDLSTFGHAMVASLQIQSTVGFAAPARDHWARNWEVVLLITLQSICTILFNIFLLGTLFARLSSAKNRAITVKLTSKAVIRSEGGGCPFFEFRIGEFRRHQLLNLNVSMYLFTHKEGSMFHRERLKINPANGIFLAVPTEIQHFLEPSSPMLNFLIGKTASISASICSVCGESFGCMAQLKLHAEYMGHEGQALENMISMDKFPQLVSKAKNQYFEIIVLVEGTEPITGSPIQIRHSYTFDDIEIGACFKKCWEFLPGRISVDFDSFNTLIM